MPISKIRKYLDDLKIQADAAKRRDIDSSEDTRADIASITDRGGVEG
jgi:hypothetical protein